MEMHTRRMDTLAALSTQSPTPLSQEEIEFFHEHGYLFLKDFYKTRLEIEPIQRGIHNLISLLIEKYNLTISQEPFSPETFDCGYQELIAHDRSIGGEIYDAVKQIPAFIRLVASPYHEGIFRQLRCTETPAIAGGGYGIRIDNPREEKFRAPWHQEYPAQFRSLDGIVFWSPLAEVTQEMGPVEICPGSHQEGLVRVHTTDPNNPEKKGAYALVLENEQERVAKYEVIAPLTKPGDLLLMDFLTLHRSGTNRSNRSRWSMQSRFFNFSEPNGMKIRWSGAFAANADIRKVHPELYID